MTAALLRLLLLILLLGPFLAAPAASAATPDGTIRTILRDCEDDGSLSGDYRASELRDALRNIGTDLDQYSDCRDVISAAVQRTLSGGGGTSGAGGGGGGGAGPDAIGGGGTGTGGTGAPDAGGAGGGGAGGGSGGILVPETPEERDEIDALRAEPSAQVVVGGGAPLTVGRADRMAAVITHTPPTPLLVALALLVAGGALAAVPAVRRRILDRRASP